jgi:prophage DNA circulation protein
VDASGVNHGFLLLPDNNIGVINVPGAGTNGHYGQGTVANSINDAGLISGYYLDAHNVFHGFVRAADAIITTFDAKGAATGFKMGTLASSINSAGVITGTFMTPDSVTHGFVRTADGVITGFDGPMAGFTSPVSINAAGVITASTECRVGLNKDSSALQMGPLRLLMFHRDSAPIPRASTRPGLSRVSTPITMELPASSAAPGRGPSPRSRLPSPAPQTP